MTSAQQWMAEGRAEGDRRTLERLLRRKFGDSAVDESVLVRLASAGEEQLAQWTDRLLTPKPSKSSSAKSTTKLSGESFALQKCPLGAKLSAHEAPHRVGSASA
ncbi:MAG: hypothetical protein R3B07_27025 [Polyangiaceae bacterium]